MAERSFAEEVEQLRIGAGETFRGEGILAITKALLENGVGYVTGYQGAPISHLMDVLADAEGILGELGVRFEASASEAAATTSATAAARHAALAPSEYTCALIQAIKGRAAPAYLLTTGRCFRPDEEDERHQKVFHQADGLCIDSAARLPALEDTVKAVLQAVLGPVPIRWRERDFGFVEEGREFDVEIRGKREEVGGCGRLKPQMLRQAGYDADRVEGYALGLGLERLVMLERGIDDIRSLWKEPYIGDGA